MTDSTGAGPKSEDDGSKSGAAHSTGESQGDSSPGDGFVKKSQFLAALSSATAKTDEAIAKAERLERELAEVRAAKAAPKPPTREELRQMVQSGDLTQDQADAVWDKQFAAQVKQEVVATVDQRAQEQARAQKVAGELQGYKELVPEVWEAGSEDRVKVGKAFDHLVSLGHDPKALATEAAALLATFGPLNALRASKIARTGPADTHAETGGGTKPAGDATKGPLKGLTADQREYYDRGIKQGRYANWDAVAEELKFASPRAKAR